MTAGITLSPENPRPTIGETGSRLQPSGL